MTVTITTKVVVDVADMYPYDFTGISSTKAFHSNSSQTVITTM